MRQSVCTGSVRVLYAFCIALFGVYSTVTDFARLRGWSTSVPLATAVSLETGLPAAFVRKEAKTYGTCQALEGQNCKGRKITFIEDIITTGGAVTDAYNLVTADDAEVLAVVCAIYRGEGAPNVKGVPSLEVRPAFTAADLTGS